MRRLTVLVKAFLIRNGYKRAEYFRKIGYFAHQGKRCYFQPYNFGTEPHLISFGRNVYIASNVQFVTHDVIALMLREKRGGGDIQERVGTIELGDNVFIGSGSQVMYDVKIGSNVIVGGGSLVTKDLPDNTVCAGRPAKPVGGFEDYERRMMEWSSLVPWSRLQDSRERVEQMQREWFWKRGVRKAFPPRSNGKVSPWS